MTIITIGNEYIKAEGHSGYAEIGKDIVCSAISTLIEATYNYMIATGNIIDKKEKEALYIIKSKKTYTFNESGKQIFASFKEMINDLANQYPKFIKIKQLSYEEEK